MADPHNRAIEDGLCKTLTWMRVKAELDHEELSARVGVSNVSIWNWENGATFPQALVTLRKWAEAVGVKLVIKLVAKDGAEHTF